MATKSYQDQLEEVQAAITVIVTKSQSVTVNSRSYTRANLKDLHDMEMKLRSLADRESRGGARIRGVTPV